MKLKHITSAEELKVLEDLDWHDSEAVAGLITRHHQDGFPSTINYSGRDYPNVHLICRIDQAPSEYLELVFVAVETMDITYLNDVFIKGAISGLGHIVIIGWKGEHIRAAALLYRFLELTDEEAKDYYRW